MLGLCGDFIFHNQQYRGDDDSVGWNLMNHFFWHCDKLNIPLSFFFIVEK